MDFFVCMIIGRAKLVHCGVHEEELVVDVGGRQGLSLFDQIGNPPRVNEGSKLNA